jgi:hypothetical protein
MVLMAIATTLLTGPLLSLIQRAAPAADADPVRRTQPAARRGAQPALEHASDTARP